MIKLINVSKIYGKDDAKVPALSNVSLTIEDGEMVAIMGSSGSGKTTLLNIIGGMDRVTEGDYYYNDLHVSALSDSKLDEFRQSKIGFVFQQFALIKDYTIFENTEIPLRAANMPKKSRKAAVKNILKRVGIEEYAGKLPAKLSGGQQQRAAIARALVSGAGLILADEPTGALDQKTGEEIMNIFAELNKNGTTVIIVTHDPKVASYAKRIIKIEDGRVAE